MADNDLRFSSSSAPTKRSTPNVSGGWVVMVLSGLIAVVIFLFLTAQGGSKTEVLVAATDIGAGQKVTASSFRVAKLNADKVQLNRMIAATDRSTYDGFFTTGPMRSGDVVMKTSLARGSGTDKDRTMSIPIDKNHANYGRIAIGDRVDLIDAKDGIFSAVDLAVVAVDTPAGSGIGGGGTNFVVTVGVDANQAVAVGRALQNDVDLVRATGAKVGDAAPAAPSSGTTSIGVTTSTTSP